MLGLKILGHPALHRDGAALPLTTRKAMALLVLLARSGGPLPRARVVALLWPALDEQVGRRNLRRELARLREAGAGDAVLAEGDALALAGTVACDVEAFDAALRDGQPDQALALWRGPPADGFALGDADAFDDWLERQREHLDARRRAALIASAAVRESAGDLAGALARIEALLAEDPLQEQHHRDAMRLLAASGRREAALAQYERCRELLRTELGLTPMADTEALAAALRSTLPVAPVAPTSLDALPLATHKAQLPERLPFVGRGEEIARLEAAWKSGRAIVIAGDAGLGKSRMAADFAAAHGPYAVARCRAGDAELPYASLGRALRALMGPTPSLADLPEWISAEVARLIPELGMAPAPIRSDEERSRFFEACARAWEALAGDSFDAILIDDWHLADAASRTLLGFIARRRAEAGLKGARELLLLRPELDPTAEEGLRALIEATGAEHLVLQPLPGNAVLELVERLSGTRRPTRFAGRLERATGGNPFFLAETLRHLIETDLLSTDDAGGWQTPFDDATLDYRELPVPASVLETVMVRVQRLPVASRRVLEAAALAAEPFVPALLAPACALSELDAVLAIEGALAARLLREHEAGGFAFVHDLVQQALAGSLSQERRRLVHRRLALGAEAAAAPSATIAAHHEASGDPARAVAHRIAAGDRARDLHALPEAMVHWLKALADGPAPAQAIELHERLMGAASHRAEQETIQAQADALGHLIEGGGLSTLQRVDATIVRALALSHTGAGEAAVADLDRIEAVAVDAQRGRHLRARCMALLSLGRSEAAMEAARAALALPDLRDGDRVELLDMAFISDHNAGRIESALAHAGAALALSLRTGNAHGIARSRYRRGLQLLQLDQVQAAEAELLAAVEDCERFGFVRTERVALYNLTCVYSVQGLAGKALAAAQRAWSLEPPLQEGALRAVLGVAMVDAHLALGDLGAAWRAAEPAVEAAIAHDEPALRMVVAAQAMETLAQVGEVTLVRRLVASIGDEALGQVVNAASEMWVALAQFELALGDRAAAALALARLDAAGGLVEERVRVRHAQARSALALADGDAAAATAALPAYDTPGMNGELRTRGLALRVAAEARLGGLQEATVAAARAALAAPAPHMAATLELHTALARAARDGCAGAPASALADHAGFVAMLAESLREHPLQQAAFLRTWA